MTTLTEVKERPILFSTPMIKAILEGRKTVTRRVIKPHPVPCNHEGYVEAVWKNDPTKWKAFDDHPDRWYCSYCGNGVDYGGNGMKCPYGKPGDVLWVRETWSKIHYEGVDENLTYIFKADWTGDAVKGIWKPSIHMPRAACRLRLEIVSITVERLQDITEEDAIREGILFYDDSILGRRFKDYEADASAYGHPDHDYPTLSTARESFFTLWQSINGPESWNANPWVWRIEFKRIQ